jgi:hypothetical protein
MGVTSQPPEHRASQDVTRAADEVATRILQVAEVGSGDLADAKRLFWTAKMTQK